MKLILLQSFLALILLSSLAAAQQVTVTAPTLFHGEGIPFTATFTISDVAGLGIISYQGKVTFDPSIIDFTSCATAGTISVNGILCNETGPGEVSFVYTHTAALLNDGDGPPSDLFRVNFTAVGTSGQVSPLTIEELQVMEFAVTGIVVPGSVTILGTTASGVSVGGVVESPDRRPIRNAIVSLTDETGTTISVSSSASGHFRFSDVAVGKTYVLSARSRRYTFTPLVLNLSENALDLRLTADNR